MVSRLAVVGLHDCRSISWDNLILLTPLHLLTLLRLFAPYPFCCKITYNPLILLKGIKRIKRIKRVK
jgi:hypothetical protein